MEHNLYDNDTDDYYDDDSDTLIMDLADICDKSYDSEEENETLLEYVLKWKTKPMSTVLCILMYVI